MMKLRSGPNAVASVFVLMIFTSLPLFMWAQDSTNDIYRKYATVPTEVPGIYTFADPPQGFNALAASDEELAMYGFPPRPDRVAHPEQYHLWEFTVKAAKTRWKGPLKRTQFRSAVPAPMQNPQAPQGQVNYQIPYPNLDWGGYGNFKNITAYSSKKSSLSSFQGIAAFFNVPIAEDAFGQSGCTSPGTEGTVTAMIGIDAPTLQGGVIAQNPGWIYSGGCFVYLPTYYAEIGAGTSNEIIDVFPVNPGDMMTVIVSDTSPTTGNVFLLDDTTGAGTTYAITTTPIIGDSAEFLMAKVYVNGVLDQIPNYVGTNWVQAYAIDFDQTVYGPGTNMKSSKSYRYTVNYEMTDDAGDQIITDSLPYTQTFKNPYAPSETFGVFFNVTNCAEDYGCTP